MSVGSCSNCSLSAILTDNEVRARILNNNDPISLSSDEIDGILTYTETKTSALTQNGITLSPESLRSNCNQDTQWWKSHTWRATSPDDRDRETIEAVSEPSSIFADTGSSFGSDADKLPSVFTPSTFCGSSC